MGKENREVKSSVLVDLMYEDESAEENERSFYNALHEEQLPNNIEIKKLRVENVVYCWIGRSFYDIFSVYPCSRDKSKERGGRRKNSKHSYQCEE